MNEQHHTHSDNGITYSNQTDPISDSKFSFLKEHVLLMLLRNQPSQFLPLSTGSTSLNYAWTDLKQQIQEIYARTNQENWDGENAEPISKEALGSALQLVELLPFQIFDPDITPTPHGEIDFDWISESEDMLTLSICPDGSLAWSAQFEDYSCRGAAALKGGLPYPLKCCLQNFSR